MLRSKTPSITAEEARDLFRYDPDTGILSWSRPSRYRQRMVCVGNVPKGKYLQVSVRKKKYSIHRVIWLMVYGQWPDADVDHINGDKLDNRLTNLRAATRSENLCNQRQRTSKSGVKGVFWLENIQKWLVSITHNKKTHRLGCYTDFDEAVSVIRAAREKLHGEFARHE